MRPRYDRNAAPRIAKVNEAQGVLCLIEQQLETFSESDRAFEEVVDRGAEAHDLDVVVKLLRRKIVAAQNVEQSAAEEIEQNASEAVDVDRRSLPRGKSIECGVQATMPGLKHQLLAGGAGGGVAPNSGKAVSGAQPAAPG